MELGFISGRNERDGETGELNEVKEQAAFMKELKADILEAIEVEGCESFAEVADRVEFPKRLVEQGVKELQEENVLTRVD